MKRFIFLFLIFTLIFVSTTAFAEDQIYRQTFRHSRGHFTDSKSYYHRVDMPLQWRNQGYKFYNFQVVTTGKAYVYDQHLSNYLFTFTMKIKKNFVEDASGSVTVILMASRQGNYSPSPTPAPYPYPQPAPSPSNNSNSTLSGSNWYYPGQVYNIQVDPSRMINIIEVRWRDAGGHSNGVLVIDGKSYGIKEVGNGNGASSPDIARWNINNFASHAEIRISIDAAQILGVQVYYNNNNSSSPSSGGMIYPANPTSPQNPSNNTNNGQTNPYTGPVTLPTGGHGHTPGNHGLPIPH